MAISFHEIQFPADISYGATGGPVYSTDVAATVSKSEQRNINWYNGMSEYQAAHGVKNQNQMKRLLIFFRNRKGKGYGFRYKDWLDFKAVGETIGTGDGVTTTYQLIKHYTDDMDYTEVRKITKPVGGTIRIYVNGVLQTAGISYDTTTGKITFTIPPLVNSVITADFEFDVPVRFDTDKMQVSLQTWNIYSWDNIPIVELKV